MAKPAPSSETSPEPARVGGHTFRVNFEICRSCHETPEANLHRAQAEIQRQLDELKQMLDEAPDHSSEAYRQAQKNYDWLINERSLGFHNFKYARALLEYSLRLRPDIYFSKPEEVHGK